MVRCCIENALQRVKAMYERYYIKLREMHIWHDLTSLKVWQTLLFHCCDLLELQMVLSLSLLNLCQRWDSLQGNRFKVPSGLSSAPDTSTVGNLALKFSKLVFWTPFGLWCFKSNINRTVDLILIRNLGCLHHPYDPIIPFDKMISPLFPWTKPESSLSNRNNLSATWVVIGPPNSRSLSSSIFAAQHTSIEKSKKSR